MVTGERIPGCEYAKDHVMRTIGVVTVGRSDYSTCIPLLQAIQADPELKLRLIVSGMHLCPEFGSTVATIEKDGFRIDERVEMSVSSDTATGTAKSIGLGTIGFADCFSRLQLDILVVLGDRFELLSVVCAALPFNIPIAHVSGGDITEGAIDNQVRFAVSQMSHLHFTAMRQHADRLLQMGEEPWRVFVSGDPALDLIRQIPLLTRDDLIRKLAIEWKRPVLLITYHPLTLGAGVNEGQVDGLLTALREIDGTLIFTGSNADARGRAITHRIDDFVKTRPSAYRYENLGSQVYYSLLANVDLLVGNSSSAIWEAPSFGLPAVNIGDRQKGRLRTANVIDVPDHDAKLIIEAIRRGLSPLFRPSISNLRNPYGDGHAIPLIIKTLKTVQLGCDLVRKRFIDVLQRS